MKFLPKVVDLIGKQPRGSLVDGYLLCRAEKSGFVKTEAEHRYLLQSLQFMRTNPSSEQYAEWHRNNPPPQAELRAEPTVLRFEGVTLAELSLINPGETDILYWLENFPDGPMGPFYLPRELKRGKIASRNVLSLEIVLTKARGALSDEYSFSVASSIRGVKAIPITIRVKRDAYSGVNRYFVSRESLE